MLQINSFSNPILKQITFALESKENLIILGENGAGKSTLAKVLCGLIESNSVMLFNRTLSELSYKERSKLINYIPAKLEVFDEYITVWEYLELSFVDDISHQKIDQTLKQVGISHLKNRSCKILSSGEEQLLLLASAIIHGAKITIFDELTANMDISRLKEVYDLLKEDILDQKIIITHNLDLAFHLNYKVLFLKDGEVTFYDEAKKFFSQENLDQFYNKTLKIQDDHLVVKL